MDRMTLFQRLYLGPRDSPGWAGNDWAASPVLAPPELRRKCPRTVIFIAGQDLLRAESFQLAERLREAGVEVDIKEFQKAPHMFMSMDRVLDSGRRAVDELVKIVKDTLTRNSEQSLEIKSSDLNNEPDRRNLLEQAKSLGRESDGRTTRGVYG